MSGFLANNQEYNITTENEVSIILSHFNTDFIFNIIKDNLSNKFKYNYTQTPNIIASFETNFKALSSTYTGNVEQIQMVRINTYREIINILCKEYGLQFNEYEGCDYYSIAYYLYGLLLSGFNKNITTFFTNYIKRERNNLYEALNLASMKKNKDTGTIYGKKLYENIKLAIINANLEYVIDNICAFDIPFEVVLQNIYYDKNVVDFILSIASPIDDFFKTAYVSALKSENRIDILTNIRFEIQRLAINTAE